MCKCENIIPQSKKAYSNMILCDIPMHMELYARNRGLSGLSAKIAIDPCIYEEIKYLWSKGIITYGSCCGHNKNESFVNVADSSINKMIKLGYVQNHTDKSRKDTFKLKTA